MDGTPSATTTGCGNDGGLWTPDLKKNEWLIDIDLMVKFSAANKLLKQRRTLPGAALFIR